MKQMSWKVAAAVMALCPVLYGQETPAAADAGAKPALAREAEPKKPARITLNLEGATAEEAFDSLAKQAGVDLVVDNPSMWQQTDLVFLNVKDAAFWPTFMQLCQQARVNFDMYHGSDRSRALRIYSGGGENRYAKLPMAEAEGFVIYAQSAQRSYSVNYDNPANINSYFNVQLMVLSDPSVPIQQMGSPILSEAVDENGVSLMPSANNRNMYYGGGNNASLLQQTGVSLSYPTNGGKKIAKMKGYLRATGITRMENIEIEAPLAAKPVKKELPAYDLIIQPLKLQKEDANQTRYEVKVTFLKKRAGASGGGLRRENQDYWNLMNSMTLLDAQGRRYNNSGGGSSGSSDSMVCTMGFYGQPSNQGAPAKLVWKLPAETRELRIPFEMKDLAIP